MRTHSAILCDNRGTDDAPTPGCLRNAATSFVCAVEGRDVDLCEICNRNWRLMAHSNPALTGRCPNCAYLALADRTPLVVPDPEGSMGVANYLDSPLAQIFDKAMMKEGLLIDVRQRVLLRLISDPDFVSREDWTSLAGAGGS